ncbi:CDP-glycerol glycerophosphotransferase family protein [Vibrio pectenicida]|uniref:CDP-glycerol glycerophosphotransferase family protein n=3 Tax=Vibrio pectenicida TaxID=62763 RepID=UPI0030818E28
MSIDNTINSISNYQLHIEIIIVAYDIDNEEFNALLGQYSILSQVSVIKSKASGIGYCFNIGAKNSRGKYLFFMKPDGCVVENGLISLYQHAEKNNLDITIGWVKYIGVNGSYTKPSHFLGRIDSTNIGNYPKLLKNTFPLNRIYKREFLLSGKELEFLDFLKYSDDSYFCINGYYKAEKVGAIDEIVYIEKVHGNKNIIKIFNESIIMSNNIESSLGDLELEFQNKARKLFLIKEMLCEFESLNKKIKCGGEDVKNIKGFLLCNMNIFRYLNGRELSLLKKIFYNDFKSSKKTSEINFKSFNYILKIKIDKYFNFVKSLLFFNVGIVASKFSDRNVSLIGEREGKTISDNGYALFKKSGSIDDFYFITRKENIKEASQYGHTLEYGSIKHLFYVGFARRYFFDVSMLDICLYWRELNTKPRTSKKLIFLQHGVTALSRASFYYDYYSMKCRNELPDMLCVTSEFERKKFISDYSFPEDIIKITGFSRYDYLPNISREPCNSIIYIPTWRNWLEHQSLENFLKSQYYQSIYDLLSKLSKLASEKNYEVTLVLHHKMSKFKIDFKFPSVSLVYMSDLNWGSLLSKGKLLITDYSSVVFDFIRLGKPAITYPFDRENFLAIRGGEMITDKETPFIASCSSSDDVIENVEKIINNENQIFKNESIFFDYHDKLNCHRILEIADKLDRRN